MDTQTENDSHEGTTVSVSAQGVSYVQADGGYSSRKLWYGIGTSIAILAGGVFYAFCAGFRPGYETMIAGLMGVLALYTGGNVAAKHVVGRQVAAAAQQAATQLSTKVDPGPRPPVEPLPPDGGEDDGQ